MDWETEENGSSVTQAHLALVDVTDVTSGSIN